MADLASLSPQKLQALRSTVGPAAQARIDALLAGSSTPDPEPVTATGARGPYARMNKTEARFARDHLEPRLSRGESRLWLFETVKLRLADRTWLTPDFWELLQDGSVHVHEVKGGYIREDARIKFRVAAEQFAWARWTMWQWKDGRWSKVLGR